MITKKSRRVWRTFTRYDRQQPMGSGYCADQWVEEHLIVDWLLFGLRVWSRTVAKVGVPSHAWISSATLGHSEWGSGLDKFKT